MFDYLRRAHQHDSSRHSFTGGLGWKKVTVIVITCLATLVNFWQYHHLQPKYQRLYSELARLEHDFRRVDKYLSLRHELDFEMKEFKNKKAQMKSLYESRFAPSRVLEDVPFCLPENTVILSIHWQSQMTSSEPMWIKGTGSQILSEFDISHLAGVGYRDIRFDFKQVEEGRLSFRLSLIPQRFSLE